MLTAQLDLPDEANYSNFSNRKANSQLLHRDILTDTNGLLLLPNANLSKQLSSLWTIVETLAALLRIINRGAFVARSSNPWTALRQGSFTYRTAVVGIAKMSSATEQGSEGAPSTVEKIENKLQDMKVSAKDAISNPAHSSMNPDDEVSKHQPNPNSTESTESTTTKPKKEKKPKQPKQSAAPAAAPLSPALIDLRVGHILRCIPHPDADSLYVSTIDMGDAPGSDHTSLDEATGKTVRTVCSGLRGLVPLEEMQGRRVVVVANLKPVTMRGIKSAAMVLAASPKAPEGADPHAHDRTVELVNPPTGAEAGDKVYFEGWPYGEGRGPEKQLNPKKKQWEAIQPGFFTGEDLTVGFDSSATEGVKTEEGQSTKGSLVVAGKGVCAVKTLKGAVVR